MTQKSSLLYFGLFFLGLAFLPILIAASGFYFIGLAAKQSLIGGNETEYRSGHSYR